MNGAGGIVATIIGSGIIGSALTLAVKWGFNLKRLSTLNRSHDSLKGRFIGHEMNTRIHRDPDRDPEAAAQIKEQLSKGFDEVNSKLSSIENRCEQRGKDCAGHFGSVERKIAFSNGVRDAKKRIVLKDNLVQITEPEG